MKIEFGKRASNVFCRSIHLAHDVAVRSIDAQVRSAEAFAQYTCQPLGTLERMATSDPRRRLAGCSPCAAT